jgi:hypothetical protein
VAGPHDEYSRRLENFLATVSAKERVHIRIGNFKLAIIAAALVVAWLSLSKNAFPSYWLGAPVLLYAMLAIVHDAPARKVLWRFTGEAWRGLKIAGPAPEKPESDFAMRIMSMPRISISLDEEACLSCYRQHERQWARSGWRGG